MIVNPVLPSDSSCPRLPIIESRYLVPLIGFEHFIQVSTCIECLEVRKTSNVSSADKDVGHSALLRIRDEIIPKLFSLTRIGHLVELDFMETDLFVAQQSDSFVAVRTPRLGEQEDRVTADEGLQLQRRRQASSDGY